MFCEQWRGMCCEQWEVISGHLLEKGPKYLALIVLRVSINIMNLPTACTVIYCITEFSTVHE